MATSAKASIQLVLLAILSSGFLCLETVRLVSCTSSGNAGCLENERKALFNFKQGLVDPSLRLSSWVGRDCCKWAGVKCNNETGHVIMINLRNEYSSPDGDGTTNDYSSPDGGGTSYALSGEINHSLLELKHLTYLDLSMNNFEGIPIPKFIGSLKRLSYLNLSGAFFGGTIPSSLGNLSSLLYLDLSSLTVESNEIHLNWLSGLSSLKHLNLESIDLSQSKTNWLQAVNMLPSLSELHLSACGLSILPPSLPQVNLTSLSVLDLSNNGFNSSIPPWLFNLSRLAYVDLSSNQLQGGVPGEFADFHLIQHIDLSENSFINGKLPRNLGKLCHLLVLDLSFNKISGEMTEFTDGLSNCTNCRLEYLHLGYNILGGNIPNSLGHLRNLKHLLLHKNPFSGSIPDSIGNLSSLEEFYLSENGMKGTIPASLGQLSSLVVLDIKNNQWEGVITEVHFSNLTSLKELSIVQSYSNITLVFNASSEWIPPFKLKYLNLKSCLVGPNFPMWLRNQNELNYVAVWHANISDTIPDWFWKLDLFLDVLDFSYNQLNGSIPNTIKFRPDAIVFLNYNRFTGPLPVFSSNVTSFHLDNNFFTGPIPEDFGERMPMLSDIDISFNSLNGSIPLSIGNLSNLLTLVLANNRLTGKIPDFWSTEVYVINVANNNLTGEIPSSFGNLGSISPIFLTLSNNQLSGEIPSALMNCTDIKTLDLGDNKLSGSVPAWIGERFPSLLILRLRSNLFHGNIPSQLCNISSLHILDLAHNNLSGSIPPCLGNLRGVSFEAENVRYEGQLLVATKGREYLYDTGTLYLVNSIDLSSNSLRGELPDLANLSRIGILNLSMNHLTGKIPESIGSLKQLETLDLSINQFVGPIPTSLASCTFLSHLNLSHNNLSGKIPLTNQFQTFNDPSIYEGNTALCGSPLPNKCNEDEEASHFPNGKERDDEDKDKLENLLFYSTIVLGFLIGFWGVCGSLIMKKSWRLAYFKLVDDMKDRLILAVSLKLARLRRPEEERN